MCRGLHNSFPWSSLAPASYTRPQHCLRREKLEGIQHKENDWKIGERSCKKKRVKEVQVQLWERDGKRLRNNSPQSCCLLAFHHSYCIVHKDIFKQSYSLFNDVFLVLLFIVQILSRVWLFEIPWIAARQSSLSFTMSRSLLKLMSVESMMPPNRLVLCHPLLLLPSIFPSFTVFSNELALKSGGQNIGASASVLPVNIQGWFPLGLTGFWCLCSPRDSQESSPAPQFESINS